MTSQEVHGNLHDRSGGRAVTAILVCIAVGLLVTSVVTLSVTRSVRADAVQETNARLAATGAAIDRQVSAYAETLYGLREDFAQNPDLTRHQFHQLVNIDALGRRNPGATSVTFNRFIATRELARFQAGVRRSIPDFAIHPANDQPGHVVVDYLEPFDPTSPALGLDIVAAPARRTALEFARDSGELSATTPISLVQSTTGPGFLLMVAAYDVSPVPVTAPARSRHFLGVLVAVFTTKTMVEQAAEARAGLPVSIYDAGATADTPRAAPRSAEWVVGEHLATYTNYADIDVGSRRWRLVTDSPVRASSSAPITAGTGGVVLTLLISALVAAITSSRRRAVKLAETMTVSLRASEERLQDANESLRNFIDITAHDLRSPLVSIAGFSALLNDEQISLSEADRRQALETIDRQSHRMGQLIEDLLTVSSIDGGALQTRPEPIRLAEFLRECLDARTNTANDITAAAVTASCPPDLNSWADPLHLRRILDNYLDNALKYGQPPVLLEATAFGDVVEISVTDHGTGVPGDFTPRMFDKFARADTPESRTQPGTGLGLSIVRGLAEANNGQALYEPNHPHGSRFSVRLPAQSA